MDEDDGILKPEDLALQNASAMPDRDPMSSLSSAGAAPGVMQALAAHVIGTNPKPDADDEELPPISRTGEAP